MKISKLLTISLISGGTSFPLQQHNPRDDSMINSLNESNCGPAPCVVFNKTEQNDGLITGEHVFQAPGPDDQRGPCPGLNAAANHGHIPRNGIVTIEQAATGLRELFGMGEDLASLSAAYAIAIAGDVKSGTFSIGGPTNGTLGLAATHNLFEGDSSPTRFDAYMNGGDSTSLNLTKFERLYSLGVENDFNDIPQINWNFSMLRPHFKYSQQESIANNPYYFSAPFSGLIVVPHTYNFVITLFSSHTELRPDGYLDQGVLKQLYGISGNPRAFGKHKVSPVVVNKGNEQVPEIWNRRPYNVTYGIAESIADLVIGYREDPSIFRLGGNLGKTNSFEAVSITKLTNGTYTDQTILDGNNLACFSLHAMLAALPDAVSPARKLLNKYIQPQLKALNCPHLAKFNKKLFEKFPGYKYKP